MCRYEKDISVNSRKDKRARSASARTHRCARLRARWLLADKGGGMSAREARAAILNVLCTGSEKHSKATRATSFQHICNRLTL